MEKHAGAIRKMGLATTIAGGVITAAFALAVKTSGAFEQSMANVAAVAGATGKELKGLSTFAREMGATTVFTASQAADAMYYLASAGYGVEKMMKALPGVLDLAAATGSELAEVTSSVVATLNQFELGAKDATRVSNVFAAAIGASQATMGKLAISMSYAGAGANALNLPLEQTTAILSKIYDIGIDASMAGTQLRMAFTRLAKPTKEVHEALAELGLTYENIDPKIHNVVDSLRLLGDRGMDLSQSLSIFGTRAGATFLKLSQRADDIDKLTTSITGTNKATEMADKMINTWQGTLRLLKSAIQEVQLIIGDVLLPVLTPMVKRFKEIVLRIGEWARSHPKLTSMMVKFGAVLGPVLIALGALMMILPSLVAALPMLAGVFALLLGPIGLIALAITGLTAAFVYFYTTNNKFRGFIDNIGQGFKALGTNIWNWAMWFKDNFLAVFKTVFLAIPVIADNALNNLIVIMRDFFLRGGWKDALTFVGESLLKAFGSAFTAVGNAFSVFKDNIMKWLGWIGEKMKPQNWLKKIEAPDWSPLFEGFKIEFGNTTKFADMEMKKLTDGVEVYWTEMPKWITPAFEAVEDGAKGTGKAIKGMGGGLKGIGPLVEDLDVKFTHMGTTITDWVQKKTEAYHRELERGRKIIAALSQSFKHQGSTITDWMTKKVEDANAKLEMANKIIKALSNNTKNLGSSITDWFTEKVEKANAELEKAQGIIKALFQSTRKLGTTITDWYQYKAQRANEELAKAEAIIAALSQSTRNLGSSITNWYQNRVKKANDELERANMIIATLSQNTRNYGSTITTWVQDKVERANEEYEKGQEIIQALSQSTKNLGSTITSWYQDKVEAANEELEKGKAIITALSQTTKNYGSTITSWIQDKIEAANRESEKAEKIIKALSQTTKNYGSTITNWMQKKYEAANKKLEEGVKIIKALSQKIKNYGSTVTDWYQKKADKANEELEKGKEIIDALSDKMRRYGSTITDWYQKKVEQANRELERGKEIIKTLISSVKNYGTTVTNWAEAPQKKLNRELELSNLYLEGLSLKASQLPIGTITDWSEGWVGFNSELERASTYLAGVGLRTTELGERQRILLKIQSELTGSLVLENKKRLDSWKRFFADVYDLHNLSRTDIERIFAILTEDQLKMLGVQKANWGAHFDDVARIWDSFASSVKSSFSDLFYDFMMGTKKFKDIWQSFVDSMVSSFVKAVADSLAEKLRLDTIFEGNILNLGNLFTGLGKLVVGVFKGIGNIVGGIFGGAGATAAASVTQSITAAGNAATVTAAKMGIMQKIGLGLQSVVLGAGKAFSFFANMGANATTVLGALGSGLAGVAGMVGTAIAGWQAFSWAAENVIGPVFKTIRVWLSDFLGMSGSVTDSIEEMTSWLGLASQQMAETWDPATLESYKSQIINVTRDVAAGIKTIGDMTREESIKWLAESIAANEQFTDEFKNTLLGILEASTISVEAIAERAKEAQVTAYNATTELYEKTRQVIEQGYNATAQSIAESVVAVEHAIEITTGKTKEAFEKQLWQLQHMNRYGTDQYWQLYNEAKSSFEATEEAYEKLHNEAERLAEEGTEAQIHAFAEQLAAHEDLTQEQKKNLYEILGITQGVYVDMAGAAEEANEDIAGTTEEATNDMTRSYNDLTREMADDMRQMKESGRTSAEDIRNFVALSAGKMAQVFGASTQSMIDSLAKIPTRIDFDILGRLHMPYIPRVSTQYFDVFGRYRGSDPAYPGYQRGIKFVPETGPAILHRGEEVKSAPEVRVERAKKTTGGDIYVNAKIYNTGDIHAEADWNKLMDRLARKTRDEVMVR